eukprot:2974908-Prymnesium_polylepis.2
MQVDGGEGAPPGTDSAPAPPAGKKQAKPKAPKAPKAPKEPKEPAAPKRLRASGGGGSGSKRAKGDDGNGAGEVARSTTPVGGDEGDDVLPVKPDPSVGRRIVVIHPGSKNLRIGAGSRALATAVLPLDFICACRRAQASRTRPNRSSCRTASHTAVRRPSRRRRRPALPTTTTRRPWPRWRVRSACSRGSFASRRCCWVAPSQPPSLRPSRSHAARAARAAARWAASCQQCSSVPLRS